MKRKIISVMLTGTMIAGMLTGCGSDSSGKSSSSVISGSSETETETTEADESDDKTPVTFEYFNADGKNGNWDNPVAKAMLVNGILEHFPEKKLVSASGMAGYGSSNTIRTRRLMKNFYLCGDQVTEPTYGHGLMAPRVAICAAHEANMITRLLLGEEEI